MRLMWLLKLGPVGRDDRHRSFLLVAVWVLLLWGLVAGRKRSGGRCHTTEAWLRVRMLQTSCKAAS